MDLCIAGIGRWGKFYKSFRPLDSTLLFFEPLEMSFTHDAYLRLVLAMYRRHHKSNHSRGTSSHRMLDCLRQTVYREIGRRRRAGETAALSELCQSLTRTTLPIKASCGSKERTPMLFGPDVLLQNRTEESV